MSSPIIWFGSKAKNLTSALQFNSFATIYSGNTDPSSVAFNGNAGDLYVSTSTFKMYQKQDSGSTTNWSVFDTGTASVTTVSVVTANGLAGTVANPTTTPAITLSTTITGILQGNGTAISAATTTGTGNVVLSNSPMLTTPNIGTATGTASGNTLASAGDINETSFSAANNQSSAANVTGLSFANATVRSFDALVSVFINATTPLYECFKLYGIQKGSTWNMSATSVGDNSGFIFSITNAGQVQYTSPNSTGFTATTVKFRAFTTSV